MLRVFLVLLSIGVLLTPKTVDAATVDIIDSSPTSTRDPCNGEYRSGKPKFRWDWLQYRKISLFVVQYRGVSRLKPHIPFPWENRLWFVKCG